jgi:PhzF family phenazine biosynthesis protein
MPGESLGHVFFQVPRNLPTLPAAPFHEESRVGFPLLQIDAFTDRPFAGNPAAVCLLPGPRDDGWMRQVGAEMNLSETAFLCQEADGYRLRWFTPKVEVDLCGHATLASAHALWETGLLRPEEEARFHTRSGLLTVVRDGEWMEMDFPAKPPAPAAAPPGLAEALGAAPRYVGRNQFDYLVEVESEEALRALAPDVARLAALPVRGVIVTARATTPGFDFVSRFFAPAAGVNEDPVTGSAHCCLGPFWRERLGRNEMRAYQASARGGVVGVRVAGERVVLRGQAVTVLRGELVC